jgi:ADP-heptose:LPS heptosyltransferase
MKKKEEIKKILILRFGAIGDIVHSSAMYRSIKKSNINMEIHYVTFKTPSEVIIDDPDLKKVWILKDKSYKSLLKLAKKLRKESFDLFINLQPSIRTKFFNFFLRAKKTITYKKTFKLHAVNNFWITAKSIFKTMELDTFLKIYIPDEIIAKSKQAIGSKKKVVVFNIGTSNTRQGRKWPIENWKTLAMCILEKYNCDIILNGAEEDKIISETLLELSPNIKSFCGKLSIIESTAVMSLASLMISGDTGPLHLATAVGISCIGLYGAAPISRTGPYGEKSFSLKSDRKCVPCNKRKCAYSKKGEVYNPCMLDLKPLDIIKVIDENALL